MLPKASLSLTIAYQYTCFIFCVDIVPGKQNTSTNDVDCRLIILIDLLQSILYQIRLVSP